jgi:uncharacterized protein
MSRIFVSPITGFVSSASSNRRKCIEIDARPSDCIAMATAQRAPIYVSLEVWQQVDDMTEALRQIHEEGSHPEESGEEEDS